MAEAERTRARAIKFTCPKCGEKDSLKKITYEKGMADSEDVVGVVMDNPPLYSTHEGPPLLCFASSGMPALETSNEDGVIHVCDVCNWMVEDDQGKNIENYQDMAKWIVEHQKGGK
jgi:hypothetical protein